MSADDSAPEKPLPSRGGPAEFFALKCREADARRRAFTSAQSGFDEFALGLAALRDGTQMANAEAGRETALVLLAAAARLLVRAAVLRELGGAADAPLADAPLADAWASAARLAAWPRAKNAVGDAGLRAVERVVTSGDVERHLAKLTPSERDALIVTLRAFTRHVAAPLEDDASAVSRVVWARRRRIGFAALAVVVAGAIPVALLLRAPDLALHAHVAVSDSEPLFPVDPKAVVDGDRTNIGFHASNKPGTTLTVDLGAVKELHRIDVYNRADCCQERVTPLSIQLSIDGKAYLTLARTERVFEKWSTPALPGMKARYVRFKHESAQYFHLSEVEVY
ncbi:MAG TPA: discoidin domain-containing protein [Polyangiaceae bacterium]|nr:discoidin domain-containing protein [Polyangiaceae bacterium]